MKKFLTLIMALLMVVSLYGCGSTTTTDTADDSYDSDDSYNSYNSYDDDYDSDYGGSYGHGEQYDKDVNDVAEAFGEDPDYVNDVYEALANEIR